MNIVMLLGRLSRDPELKFGKSGKAYARFSLAINRPFQKDETDFINCVAFGKIAELIGEYLRKGKKVAVNGRLQMNKFENNGERRVTYDVLVDNVEFLEYTNSNGSNGNNEEKNKKNEKEPSYKAPDFKQDEVEEDFQDEFPF